MFCPMPVVNAEAVLQAKMETKGIYQCPVYQTQQRGPTFVFFAPLRTKEPADKWVLAGAVIIMLNRRSSHPLHESRRWCLSPSTPFTQVNGPVAARPKKTVRPRRGAPSSQVSFQS